MTVQHYIPGMALPMVDTEASDEWYTPRWCVEAARAVLGEIDLDPASNAAAQEVIGAARHYTAIDDGLAQPWAGRVWCNPPYSNPLPWVDKLVDAYESNDVPAALLLLNLAGSPAWARRLWSGGYAVCVLNRRIQYWRPGWAGKSYDRDSAVWYFGPRRARFAEVFAPHGAIR